jgi:NAD:arginine ADP-ribosyltransferase
MFIGFCAGNTRLFEHCWDRCQRHTPDGQLSKWERLAVWLYATTGGSWYRHINQALRAGHMPEKNTDGVAQCLAAGLEKLARYKGRVYRGIDVESLSSFLTGYKVDAEVVWLAFSSASANPDYAVKGNVLFIIESNDGRVLGEYADLREEQEVVFLPESRFRVLGVEQDETKAIITLEELAPLERKP